MPADVSSPQGKYSNFLKSKIQIGNSKGPITYTQKQTVFHHDDVPTTKRISHDEVVNWKNKTNLPHPISNNSTATLKNSLKTSNFPSPPLNSSLTTKYNVEASELPKTHSPNRLYERGEWNSSYKVNEAVPVIERKSTENYVHDHKKFQYNYRAESLDSLRNNNIPHTLTENNLNDFNNNLNETRDQFSGSLGGSSLNQSLNLKSMTLSKSGIDKFNETKNHQKKVLTMTEKILINNAKINMINNTRNNSRNMNTLTFMRPSSSSNKDEFSSDEEEEYGLKRSTSANGTTSGFTLSSTSGAASSTGSFRPQETFTYNYKPSKIVTLRDQEKLKNSHKEFTENLLVQDQNNVLLRTNFGYCTRTQEMPTVLYSSTSNSSFNMTPWNGSTQINKNPYRLPHHSHAYPYIKDKGMKHNPLTDYSNIDPDQVIFDLNNQKEEKLKEDKELATNINYYKKIKEDEDLDIRLKKLTLKSLIWNKKVNKSFTTLYDIKTTDENSAENNIVDDDEDEDDDDYDYEDDDEDDGSQKKLKKHKKVLKKKLYLKPIEKINLLNKKLREEKALKKFSTNKHLIFTLKPENEEKILLKTTNVDKKSPKNDENVSQWLHKNRFLNEKPKTYKYTEHSGVWDRNPIDGV